MLRNLNILLQIIILLNLFSCSDSSEPEEKIPPRELTIAEKEIVSSDNNFGLKLFREVIKEEPDVNVFISPLSVSMALGMTYNGSAGTSREAMQQTLELNGLSEQEINESYQSMIKLLTGLDKKVVFQIANSIWYKLGYNFEEDFINLNKTYFNAQVTELDFYSPEAPDLINAWVDDKTNGKIKKIVESPIDPEIVMFLINAIYFKGNWSKEFIKDSTIDDFFTLPDDSKKSCKMMRKYGEFLYYENSEFQAIDLPYGDGYFSMTIFLPQIKTNINNLIQSLTQSNWDSWLSMFNKKEGTLHFPKFKLEYEISLPDALKALGMGIAFDPCSADFSNMYKGPNNLYISDVKHKTFVDVNEEGTEAAAVTSVEIGETSIPEIFNMYVNRPFVFAIRENHSGTILFIGKIVEPKY
jgi:serine protease inhibitor